MLEAEIKMKCVFCGCEINEIEKAEHIEACKECDESLDEQLKEIIK